MSTHPQESLDAGQRVQLPNPPKSRITRSVSVPMAIEYALLKPKVPLGFPFQEILSLPLLVKGVGMA